MLIYAARHGQTEMNVRDVVSGVTDVELTEEGIRQAQRLAEKLAAEEEPISRILASPMKRAMQTSAVIADRLGLPVQTDVRLREQNYGIYEGKGRFTEGFLQNKSQFAVRYPGGESMLMTGQRVYQFLDDAIRQYAPENILVVAHGGVLRLLRTYFLDMTNDEFFHYSADNAGFEVYRAEDIPAVTE